MVEWQDGTKVSDAYVDSNNNIVPAVYSGNTPLSAYNLNKMQQLIDVYRNNYITAKTVEGAGKIRKIFGNLSQKTSTQGKNLCPTNLSEWESGHYNNVGVKENNAYRIRLKKLLRVTPNTVYYVTTNATSYRIIIRLYDSTGVFLSSLGSVNNATTFTTTIDTYYISISIWNASGGETSESYSNYETLFNNTIKPFICLNSETDKTYEEFTPNMPSPNYPAEIEVVGNNINLFDKTAISANKGISYSNGTEYSNNTVFSTDYIDIKGIDNVCWNGVSDSNSSTWGALYDASKNYLSGVYVSTKKYEITNSNAKYIRLTFLSEYLDILKIEKGTKSTGYTEYGCGGIDYKTRSKNKFNIDAFQNQIQNLGKTYANVAKVENGFSITATGADCYFSKGNASNDVLMEVTPNVKNYLSYNSTGSTSIGKYLHYYDEDYNLISPNNWIGGSNKTNFIPPNNAKYAFIRFGLTNQNGVTATITNIMLCTEDVEYIPCQIEETTLQLPQNEFLAKIADYQDYIDEDGTIHKIIKKIVLNGTENWEKSSSISDNYSKFYLNTDYPGTNELDKLYCSHFVYGRVLSLDKNCIQPYKISENIGFNIAIENSIASTVSAFKSFLANQYANGTPVEVYYVLTEPYTTTCDFKNIVTQYAEKTNLICDTEVEAEFTQSDGIATVLKSMGIIQKKILEQEAE